MTLQALGATIAGYLRHLLQLNVLRRIYAWLWTTPATLPTYEATVDEDWVEWKQTFWATANANGWTETQQKKKLVQAFTGAAADMARDIIDDIIQSLSTHRLDTKAMIKVYDMIFLGNRIWSTQAIEDSDHRKNVVAPWDPHFAQTHGYRRMTPPSSKNDNDNDDLSDAVSDDTSYLSRTTTISTADDHDYQQT